MRGRKPKPVQLRVITGNPGRRPLPEPHAELVPHGALLKPKRLRGRPSAVWDEVVAAAGWLSAGDEVLLMVYCNLAAQFEKDPAMVASRISQLRSVASELGLSPVARLRLGENLGRHRRPDPADDDAGEAFLQGRGR